MPRGNGLLDAPTTTIAHKDKCNQHSRPWPFVVLPGSVAAVNLNCGQPGREMNVRQPVELTTSPKYAIAFEGRQS